MKSSSVAVNWLTLFVTLAVVAITFVPGIHIGFWPVVFGACLPNLAFAVRNGSKGGKRIRRVTLRMTGIAVAFALVIGIVGVTAVVGLANGHWA